MTSLSRKEPNSVCPAVATPSKGLRASPHCREMREIHDRAAFASTLANRSIFACLLMGASLCASSVHAQADSTYSRNTQRHDAVYFPHYEGTVPAPGASTGYSLLVSPVPVANARGVYTTFGPFQNSSTALLSVMLVAGNDNSVGCLTVDGQSYGCAGKGASLTVPVAPGSLFTMTMKDGERIAISANQSGLTASAAGVPSARDFANPVILSQTADPSNPCNVTVIYSDGSRVTGTDPSPACNPLPDPGAGS